MGSYRFHQKIGDEMSINVWNDPWLWDANNLCLETPMIPDFPNLKVHELMAQGHMAWDFELLSKICNENYAIYASISVNSFAATQIEN